MMTIDQFNKAKAFSNYLIKIELTPITKEVNGKTQTILEKRWVLYFKLGQAKAKLAKALTWPWSPKDEFVPQTFIAHVLRNP